MADREKVLKGLECCCSMTGEACRQCPYDEECAKMIGSGSAHLCANALELLNEQPGQKHGHWKCFTQSRYFGMDDDGEPIFRDGFFYVCSECRRKMVIRTQFCPQCGARMDEEVKQE